MASTDNGWVKVSENTWAKEVGGSAATEPAETAKQNSAKMAEQNTTKIAEHGSAKMAEQGVTASDSINKNSSRPAHWFRPGQSGNPNGRPRKEQEKAYLTAVTTAATPEQIQEKLQQLLNHPSSWRAQVAAIELCLHYGLGKPIQRTMNVENTLADLLAQLPAEDEQ